MSLLASATEAVTVEFPRYTIPVLLDAGKTCTSTELSPAGMSARSCTAVVHTFTVQ